ncbi:universal stress protein Sll1388-like isoform X2 [Crassostrea virginica]
MKVLLATDESKIAKETLKWYMQNLHKDDNQLNLVHVIDNCYQFENKGDQHLFVLAHDEKKDNAKKLMVEMEDFLKSNKINGEVSLLYGDAGEEIVKRARQIGASLVVTGSRGLGVIRRAVLGSVSDYVLHHVNVPVVIYTDKYFNT